MKARFGTRRRHATAVIATIAIVVRYMNSLWVSWMSTRRPYWKGMNLSRHVGNCSPQARWAPSTG